MLVAERVGPSAGSDITEVLDARIEIEDLHGAT
jgi:hypothetical protein